MGEVLSQAEIDNLLSAIAGGEVDVNEMQERMSDRSRTMTSSVLLNFPKSISELWSLYLNIMAGFYLPVCRFICARVFRLPL